LFRVVRTDFENVFITQPDSFEDFRGEYVEIYNQHNYSSILPSVSFVQDDVSVSSINVLRGIHGDDITWKLISCLYGRIYLVVIDCDIESKTFGKWMSIILSDKNRFQILIPPKYGNAHLSMKDSSIIHYKQSTYYDRSRQFSYKWNDDRFKINWPISNPILSQRDG
jgi:dTDP-4-dehydrorhamnose 3,5-epimerase